MDSQREKDRVRALLAAQRAYKNRKHPVRPVPRKPTALDLVLAKRGLR